MAFKLKLEGVRSMEGEWEGVFKEVDVCAQSYWEVTEVPVATGPYRTWRIVRLRVETLIPVTVTLCKRTLSESPENVRQNKTA